MSDDFRNSIAKVFVALFFFGVGLILVIAIGISALTIPVADCSARFMTILPKAANNAIYDPALLA